MSAAGIGWGILGTADIARKNWLAILNSGNRVVAVGSRDLKRAKRFAEYCHGHAPMSPKPQAFGTYDELLRCPIAARATDVEDKILQQRCPALGVMDLRMELHCPDAPAFVLHRR